jgi:hypothetical protein
MKAVNRYSKTPSTTYVLNLLLYGGGLAVFAAIFIAWPALAHFASRIF